MKLFDYCTDVFTENRASDVFGIVKVENKNGKTAVAGKRRCGVIHNTEVLFKYFVICQLIILDSISKLVGVLIVNTVNVCCLEENVAVCFNCSESRT